MPYKIVCSELNRDGSYGYTIVRICITRSEDLRFNTVGFLTSLFSPHLNYVIVVLTCGMENSAPAHRVASIIDWNIPFQYTLHR